MFIKTKAFSRQIILDLIHGEETGIDYFKSKIGGLRFCLISVVTNSNMNILDNGKEKLKEYGMREGMSLVFADLLKPVMGHAMFNDEQAQQVIAFVREQQKYDEQEYLVVHCDAGIRRSGAIVTWASMAFGIELIDKDLIWPNTFVLKKLQSLS